MYINNNNTAVFDCTLKVDMPKMTNLALFLTFGMDYSEPLARKQKVR